MQRSYRRKTNEKGMIVLTSLILVFVMCISYVGALSRFSSLSLEFSFDSNKQVDDTSDDASSVPETERQPLPVDYDYYDELSFKTEKYKNSEVRNGTLAIVKSGASGAGIGESSIIQSDVMNVYNNRGSSKYGLSGTGLTLYGDALGAFDSWLDWFIETASITDVCIDKAYCSSSDVAGESKLMDLCSGFSLQLVVLGGKYKLSDEVFSPLREQTHMYGIIQRYPMDKHTYTGHDVDYGLYRYVGVAHSDYMQKYKLSLEEYIDKIRTEKVIEFKSRIEPKTAYVVYYVPVNDQGNSTEIPLPNGGEVYQISGDGSNGFIVTVKIPI